MQPGQIGWIDLTLEDAPRLRDFYAEVTGWSVDEHSMGGYADFVMKSGDEAVAGICHSRGGNANQPPGWMIYIVVESLAGSIAACESLGGRVRVPARTMGDGSFAIIEDPAGSVCALFEAS